jgi:hypothetical protein
MTIEDNPKSSPAKSHWVTSSSDPRAFWALRETPLHEMTPAQWQDYYPAMSPWLQAADAQIRYSAVERLMTAVFWSEFSNGPRIDGRDDAAKARLAWLLSEIERAHNVHPDIIPSFLCGLRYHGDRPPYSTPLLAWLDTLAKQNRDTIDPGLLKGTRLMIAGHGGNLDVAMTEWLALLDDPSDYVRGCAAYLLGNASDEDGQFDTNTLFGIIGSKELERPGIAGPFWTPQQNDIDDAKWQLVTQWMLGLLERRQGLPPPLPAMPFNDIEFYLHELCCFSPELMWRMLRGGRTALALMTATEMSERVEGVQPVLEALALHDRPEISARAKTHLAEYYSAA